MAISVTKSSEKKEISPPVSVEEIELEDSYPLKEAEIEEEGFKLVENKERKLPKFPVKKIEAGKADILFFDGWVKELIAEDYNHLDFYLYRTWPIINRQIDNPKAAINIAKLVDPAEVSRDWILKEHGSGDYKLLINDRNNTVKGKGGTLGIVMISIREPDYPPRPILREVDLSDPVNRNYVDSLKAQGLVSNEGKVMTPQSSGGGDNAALIALLTQLINQRNSATPVKDTTQSDVSKMFLDANAAALSMLRDQAKSDGPASMVTLISAIKELIPQPVVPQGNGDMMTFLTLLMNSQQEASKQIAATNAQMIALLTNKPEKDPELAMLEKMAMYKEMFQGEGTGGSGKKSTLEVVAEIGAPVLGKALDIVGHYMTLATLKAKSEAGMPIRNVTPQVQPQTVEAQPIGIPEGEELPKDNVIEMPKRDESANPQLVQVIQFGKDLILASINRGDDGFTFAEHLEGLHGKLAYEQLANSGEEELIKAMKAVPEFWNPLASLEPTVRKFVQEFIEYKDAPVEGGEEEIK